MCIRDRHKLVMSCFVVFESQNPVYLAASTFPVFFIMAIISLLWQPCLIGWANDAYTFIYAISAAAMLGSFVLAATGSHVLGGGVLAVGFGLCATVVVMYWKFPDTLHVLYNVAWSRKVEAEVDNWHTHTHTTLDTLDPHAKLIHNSE